MAESVPERTPELLAAGRDEEIASAKQALRELDKSWRATRTYGSGNAVTRRFFDQLQALMLAHLDRWPLLGLVVDPTELRLQGEVVYRSEDSLGESLAFRLYGDGVREVRFEHGLSPDDLRAFLDALWGRDEDGSGEDDDVVTRLWSKDLAAISFVTAEDILQAPSSSELEPQEHGFFAPPPASFSGVLERERSLSASASTASTVGPPAPGENLKAGGGGLVGYEVHDAERASLEERLQAERGVESDRAVLSMLQAILESERGHQVLMRALGVMPAVIDALLERGSWPQLVDVLAMLERGPEANPALGPAGRLLVQRLIESLSFEERVARLGKGLAADPARPLDGLSGLFARLQPMAVGPLCGVLANLGGEEQRAAVRDTLIRLGPENPEPVLQGLGDARPQLVLDLVAVIVAWRQPQAAGVLSMLAHHGSAAVRAEALASIARLHAKGDGAPVIAFASDADREVRQHALRLLASGRYAAPWGAWRPHLADPEALLDQPRADRRMIFHALRVTAGDGAVPYWLGLLEARGWKQRQVRVETALLAVKELAALGTPLAREALERGQREASSQVRKACAAALAERKVN